MKTQSSFFSLVVILVMLTGVVFQVTPAYAAAGISDTFRYSTAPNWNLTGNAILTGGSVDADGDGWLRLTSNGIDLGGSAIYGNAFSNVEGVQISFDYASYGGTGADGFTFYLIDGSTTTPTLGAVGGSLGYSYRTLAPAAPGVTNGYVGIGFDEYGNFSNVGYGSTGTSQQAGLTIRGPGNLNTGFPLLTHVNTAIETTDRAGAKHVVITITPSPTQKISVTVDGVALITNYDMSAYVMPTTFKMGFSASTGASTNFHEIRNLIQSGITPSTTTIGSSNSSTTVGSSVTFTATVTCATPATGTVTFLDGATVLGSGTLNGGTPNVATYTTSTLTVGSHTITAQYSGDSTCSASSGTVTQLVSSVVVAALTVTASGPATVLPGGQYTYTFAYTTTASVSNTQVAFTLPGHTTYASNTGGYVCTPSSGVVTCSLGTIAVNGSFDVTVAVDKLKKVNTPLTLATTAYSISATGVTIVNGTVTVTANTLTPFTDVFVGNWALDYIQSVWAYGISFGCALPNPLTAFCPNQTVTRGEMSIFMERAVHTSAFDPGTPAITFTDTNSHFARYWIEALKSDGITGGCGTIATFCPDSNITRVEMSIFLLRGRSWPAVHVPPPSTGMWPDVSPTYWGVNWVDELGTTGISSGCGSGYFCPNNAVIRSEMAALVERTFNLTMPSP